MADAAHRLTPAQIAVTEGLKRAESSWRGEQPFSVRRFEALAGLPNGILGKLRSGRVSYLRGDMARRVGAALGIDWRILASREPSPGPVAVAPSPPRAGAIVPTSDHEELIEQAYDGARHRLADVRAVDAVITAHWRLMQGAEDAVDVTRLWLDTAAEIRARGGVATSEAVSLEVARKLLERRRS